MEEFQELDWLTVEHKLRTQAFITEDFKFVMVQPKGLKLQLRPHQATLVEAMTAYAMKRYVWIESLGKFAKITGERLVAESGGMVLSEPFGTGKTIIILAVLMLCPVPKKIAESTNFILNVSGNAGCKYNADHASFKGFRHQITRQFKSMIKTPIVVVGASVISQWSSTIREFTTLKVFSIAKVDHLREFYRMFKEATVDKYDIVLVKNGVCTGNFLLDDENAANVPQQRTIINVLGRILRETLVPWAVWDDFDTIQIPSDARAINAIMHVFVSATTKPGEYAKKEAPAYKDISELIRANANPLLNRVYLDKNLFTTFNFRNTEEFTRASMNLPIIRQYMYKYKNSGDAYIGLLGAMGEADANGIMEMLNGDAIGTAANTLGINTTSIADIFQKVLDTKYDRYLHDCKVLDAIDFARKVANGSEEHPKGKHAVSDMDGIRALLVRPASAADIENAIKYTSDALIRMFDEMRTEYIASRENNNRAIERVRSNLREGECPICCVSLAGKEVVIAKCCGIAVCGKCLRGFRPHMGYGKNKKLQGRCANCKADVDLSKDIIYLDNKVDLNALLTARGDEAEAFEKEPAPVEVVPDDTEPLHIDTDNEKIRALINIIHGRVIERKEIEVDIEHLVKGDVDIPFTGSARKVLVFANYNETLDLIRDALDKHEIAYHHLRGTYSEMHNIAKKYKENPDETSVMLVNAQHYCAGLNLQNTTDLVYFHKILDANIASQVAGRAQRIGRKCNLTIHNLLYHNESVGL